jgi:GT2 family glycosyltransferase
MRPAQIVECIKSIESDQAKVRHEIIVVTPADVWPDVSDLRHIDNVHLIAEPMARGVVSAVSRGFSYATGEFVCTLSDECRVCPGWSRNMIDFLEQEGADEVLGNFRVFDKSPTKEFYYYHRKFSIFPFLSRHLIRALPGGFFDDRFRCFYADPDLGLRVWQIGGRVLTCENASIFHPYVRDENNNKNRSQYEQADKKVFRERWDKEFPGVEFYSEHDWKKGGFYDERENAKTQAKA